MNERVVPFNSNEDSVAKRLRLPFCVSSFPSCINTLQIFVVASPRLKRLFHQPPYLWLKHTLSLGFYTSDPPVLVRNQIELNAYARNRRAITVAKTLRIGLGALFKSAGMFLFGMRSVYHKKDAAQEIPSGLKILSWVILACQFKSGPGHQLPLESGVCAGFARSSAKTQNVSKRVEKCVSRHTMTHDFHSQKQHNTELAFATLRGQGWH